MKIKMNKIYLIAILIIVFLLITNLLTIFILKDSSSTEAGQEVGNSLIDPARPLYSDENLVTNIEPLRKFLKSLPEREKDKADISIYFEVLTTGANVSVNADLKLWPASLAKLPLAMVVMKKIEEGSLQENSKIVFTKEDEDPTDTSDLKQIIGNEYTIQDLLEKLLVYSSNPAYTMLKRQVTTAELAEIVNAVGLEELFTPEGKVSAKEYSRLFRALYVASYLKPENSQKLLANMQKSSTESFLRAGLPKDIAFAHKWGENSYYNVHSDSGVVYASKRPYLITVMIQPKANRVSTASEYSRSLMKEISEKSYKFIVEDKLD